MKRPSWFRLRGGHIMRATRWELWMLLSFATFFGGYGVFALIYQGDLDRLTIGILFIGLFVSRRASCEPPC